MLACMRLALDILLPVDAHTEASKPSTAAVPAQRPPLVRAAQQRTASCCTGRWKLSNLQILELGTWKRAYACAIALDTRPVAFIEVHSFVIHMPLRTPLTTIMWRWGVLCALYATFCIVIVLYWSAPLQRLVSVCQTVLALLLSLLCQIRTARPQEFLNVAHCMAHRMAYCMARYP